MSKASWRVAVGAGVGLAMLAMAGCSANTTSSDPAAQGLHQGLNVLSQSPKIGVSLAFVKNHNVIYMQTRVGKLKAKMYREKFPNEPQHETDMRVLDAQGRTFILVKGGDQFIDPSWAKDLKSTKQITTKAEAAEREADFALAGEASKAFAKTATPKLARAAHLMVSMTRTIPSKSSFLQARAKLVASRLPALSPDRMYSANGCAANLQEGDLYAKSLDIIAQHSSVDAWNYNGCTSSWDQELVSCNHGSCATSSDMTYQCSSYSDNWQAWNPNSLFDYYVYEPSSSDSGSNSVTAACKTHYGIDAADVTVYGGGDPNHVCNDDSEFELDEIHYQRTNSSSWSGKDGEGDTFTCNFYSHWYGPLDSDGWAPTCL